MNTELMLKLADMLDADADNPEGMSFNIHEVAVFKGTGPLEKWKPGLSCNTTGCAMGLAMLSGEFPGLGWTYYYVGSRDVVPMYQGERCCYDDAACYIFDISLKMASNLFSPGCYPENERIGAEGERAVAARIREVVATATRSDAA